MSDVSETDRSFLTGEAIEGEPLARKLEGGGLSPAEAVQCALAVGGALQQVHSKGTVHGGLSTEKVIFTVSGPQVLEPSPGAADEVTRFSSPEQVKGTPPDTRSDIFAFGAIVYESITGTPAFPGKDRDELIRSILEFEPPSLSSVLGTQIPATAKAAFKSLDAVVTGCLMKDPDRRRQRIQNAITELKLVARPLAKVSLAPAPKPAVKVTPPLVAEPVAPPASVEPVAPPLFAERAAPRRSGEPAPPPSPELVAPPPSVEPVAPPPSPAPAAPPPSAEPVAPPLSPAPAAPPPSAEPAAPPPSPELVAPPSSPDAAPPSAEPLAPPHSAERAAPPPSAEPVAPPPSAKPVAPPLSAKPVAPPLSAAPAAPPPSAKPAVPPPSAEPAAEAPVELVFPPDPPEPEIPLAAAAATDGDGNGRHRASTTRAQDDILPHSPVSVLAPEPFAEAPVEQGLELVVPRPIPVEPAPAARTTATAEPFLQRAVPIDARPSAVPTPETVESTLDFPPMAGFINPAPEPADRAAVPLMESRPARREPRLGKLLPRLAPMLDQEFVNASAHSPVEELPPPPPAPAAPTPPAVEERAPSRPWPPPFTAKPEFEPVPPEVTVSALRVKPVEPSPRTATPGRVPYGPGEITYSGGIRTRFILLAAAMLVIVASIIGTALYLARTHTPQVLKFAVPPPEHTSYPGTPAVSPDGKYLAFSASGPEGRRMLWLRPLDALHATVIPGSEGGFAPFWSPDSQYIAFFADKALKKVRASGSTPQTICEAEGFAAGGSWNRDGIILFAPGLAGKLYRVHANGGRPEEVTDLSEEGKERAHLWPRFLPDGKRFTFYCLTDTEETSGVYTGSLNSRTTQRLLQSDSNAVFSAAQASDANPGRSQQGYLLFVRNRGLYGQKFDAGSKDVNGTPFLVAEDVGAVRSMALAPVSVSDNGVLVYQTLGQPTHQLLWFDRFGRQQSAIGEPAEYGEPRISPDGRRVAVSKAEPGKDFADIWVFNEDGSSTRVTSTPHDEGSPVWSPDGSRLAYFSNEEGAYNLYQKSLAGARSEALLRDGQQKYPVDWSGDGRYLIYGAFDRTTKMDLWVLHMGDRRKFSLVQTIAVEAYAVLSPDGRWLAYETSSEGRPEVFVQPFRSEGGGTERHYKISTDGGGHPRWRNDGKEIYYITKSGRLMAAAVRPGDTTFESDAPQVLFQTRPIPKAWNVYDSTADGNRFLVRVPLEWSSAAPITVVTNWTQKVKL